MFKRKKRRKAKAGKPFRIFGAFKIFTESMDGTFAAEMARAKKSEERIRTEERDRRQNSTSAKKSDRR
jgi:hypothetical protein